MHFLKCGRVQLTSHAAFGAAVCPRQYQPQTHSVPDDCTWSCRGKYPAVPEQYSEDLRALVGLLLRKDPRERPTAEAMLSMPYVRQHLQVAPKYRRLPRPEVHFSQDGIHNSQNPKQVTPCSNGSNQEAVSTADQPEKRAQSFHCTHSC